VPCAVQVVLGRSVAVDVTGCAALWVGCWVPVLVVVTVAVTGTTVRVTGTTVGVTMVEKLRLRSKGPDRVCVLVTVRGPGPERLAVCNVGVE